MKTFARNSRGFTIVELMVVVAIVGILAKVAQTNYLHFVAKARQAEAKIGLSAIYTAEQTFFSEFYSYTPCLRQIGYVPDSSVRYYLIGFSYYSVNSPNNTCGPDGTQFCGRYKYTGSAPPVCNSSDPNHVAWPAPLTASDIAYSATDFQPNGNYYNRPINWHLDSPGLPTAIHSKSFVAGAAGAIFNRPASTALKGQPDNVNSGGCCDGWTMNEKKQLINTNPGI